MHTADDTVSVRPVRSTGVPLRLLPSPGRETETTCTGTVMVLPALEEAMNVSIISVVG